jgi:hypothetical protein
VPPWNRISGKSSNPSRSLAASWRAVPRFVDQLTASFYPVVDRISSQMELYSALCNEVRSEANLIIRWLYASRARSRSRQFFDSREFSPRPPGFGFRRFLGTRNSVLVEFFAGLFRFFLCFLAHVASIQLMDGKFYSRMMCCKRILQTVFARCRI